MTARVSLITITNISAKKLVNLKYEAVADFETEEQRLWRTPLLFSITNRELASASFHFSFALLVFETFPVVFETFALVFETFPLACHLPSRHEIVLLCRVFVIFVKV